MCQGKQQMRRMRPTSSRSRCACWAWPPLESQTTLGNGYLGSRIDEERSKMRYLCELQNPVNHRVFERKLRPKPSGRGHACLGVTHPRRPQPCILIGTHGIGAEIGPPVAYGAVGLNWSPLRWTHD
ncbi:hypothetical protein L1887_51168 [Cichorium endivia]|nr:hypothetical protein L1887_51168 [Cichorium endivia]